MKLCLAAALGVHLVWWLLAEATVYAADSDFIGWEGEAYNPDVGILMNLRDNRTHFDPEKDPWVECVAWKPRVFIYHNFLTDAESRHIVHTAAPQMKRSTVVGEGGKSVEDQIRTSYGTFIRRLQDDVMAAVEQRLADWTQLPAVHQEDLQVLRYDIGQKYGAHYDSLIDESPRIATVLLYLNDVEEGGETAFPHDSEWRTPEIGQRMGPFSACAQGHVAFKPRRNDALLFYSLSPDGSQDPASLHTGCPVVKGIKWTATKWIHTKPFRESGYKKPQASEIPQDPGLCLDLHNKCQDWADSGECEKNPGYMIGGDTGQGNCRKACRACKDCAKGDDECLKENRRAGGFLVDHPETDIL